MFSRRIPIRSFFTSGPLAGNAELLTNCQELVNRNPRNLEKLRIARKPSGYHLEKPGRSYWHRLVIEQTHRGVTAKVEHFENGVVVSAASQEWGIRKQLYRPTDRCAFINVGRVLAQRCLESGICEMFLNKSSCTEKTKLLVSQLEENGIALTEPEVYKHPNSWDKHRPPKPWESFE